MPYYPNAIQFNYIRPAGEQAGVGDNIGWHTFPAHLSGVAGSN
jgi:hypothetical protein